VALSKYNISVVDLSEGIPKPLLLVGISNISDMHVPIGKCLTFVHINESRCCDIHVNEITYVCNTKLILNGMYIFKIFHFDCGRICRFEVVSSNPPRRSISSVFANSLFIVKSNLFLRYTNESPHC